MSVLKLPSFCVVLLFFSVLWSAVAVRADDVERDDVIELGMSGAFSGASADLGTQLLNGMQVYFDHVNGRGGIGGRQVVIRALDDRYSPHPAIDNTIRLIERDQVFALIGYVGTPTVTRVLPLLSMSTAADTYLFFPFTGAEVIRSGRYQHKVFNLRASYWQETAALVARLLAAGRQRIAVFYQADAYGRSGWDGTRRALREHGLNIVAEATYRRGARFDEDYSAQVSLLRQAGADAVISVASYAAAAGFIRDARDAGWQLPIANLSFAGSVTIRETLARESLRRERDYTQNLIFTEVVPDFTDASLPAVAEYQRLMCDRGLSMSFVSLEGFLNAKVMSEVLQRLGNDLSAQRLPEVIASLQGFDIGIGEPIDFNNSGRQGLQGVYFFTLQDQMLMPVRDWSRWEVGNVTAF